MKDYFPLIGTLSIYKKPWYTKDLIAGLTVGIMLIPQAMAYALLAGLPPIYGLYASIVPILVYSFLGTSRQLAVGPVAMISLLVSSGVGALATQGSNEFIMLAFLLAFMVGIIQLSMGVLKLGNLINLLPHSAIAGFTTGAAILIIGSQLKSLLGLEFPRGNFIETIYNILIKMNEVHLHTFIIAATSIIILALGKKWKTKFPIPLMLIVVAIIFVSYFQLNQTGVKIIGNIPEGLPKFKVPAFSISSLISLLPIALIISIISFMESIAVAKAIQAKRKNYQINNNQELIALGMANILGSFFQSYPTTGGFSRTAVNDQAGAQTGIASLYTAVLIIITLLFLTSLFYYLPMAVLASIIVVAVAGLVDLKEAKHLFLHNKMGFIIFTSTVVSTVFINVEVGLLVGVLVSISCKQIEKYPKQKSVTKVTSSINSNSQNCIKNHLKLNKMTVEQIYTGCLSQGAYYIHSEGEAAIIDPLREVGPYLQKAKEDNVKIKYIFETHFHADFVSGHLTLSKQTGAPIIYGQNADPNYEAHIAQDGEEFKIGKVTIKALHTPGHTMESTSYLLLDENRKEVAIFTGDTLFLGDVGRPDLAQKSANINTEDLASYAYDSLRNKIMPLPNDVLVYPGHGAGSACGKNMMKETVDTLGNQKKMNYALRADMAKEEFIKEVVKGLEKPPAYFPLNVKMNKEGYEHIDKIYNTGLKALNTKEFEFLAEEMNALMLDVRSVEEYSQAHIPNSIFIGLDGSFAPWVGELIVDVKQNIILITPPGREKEAVTRLARVGFDNTLGYLEGGMEAWEKAEKEIDTVSNTNAKSIEENQFTNEKIVIDVRRSSEYDSEHVLDAANVPLSEINKHLAAIPKERDFYIHCASGYRSIIAASILKSRGYHNLINVTGGFKSIKETQTQITDYICPTTL